MQTKNLIKALERIGLKVESSQRKIYDYFAQQYTMSSIQYTAKSKNKTLSFFNQDGLVVGCKVRRNTDNDEIESDYCAGYFVDTIKSAINGMQEQ